MLKRKGLVIGVSIGVVCGLLALPALQSAFADENNADLQSKKTQIEQQDEQLDAKEDQLEKDLAAGKITEEEYEKQDKALDEEDNKLEQKENEIDKSLDNDDDDDRDDDDDQDKKPNANKEQIAQAKRELAKLEKLEAQLDAREDKLENDFESGKITKAEFEKQMKALEAEESKLDAQEDKWERILGDED